ncbi:hypothetical protein Sste5346_009183 [Sporothrix stenoceras]|uniref:Glucose-methanol-choline oxidoreductase N-terminal domain-containing protein n=1 Tax=Sporothrix stenoceras TaxID=5173 RepID=A0ABR3YMC5_9PEZI
MGIYNQLPSDLNEVDVIIAGGGTAGCIVASRIAEADPNVSILIVEGGKNNHNVESVVHPALFLENLAPTTTTANFHVAKASKALNDRQSIVPTGGTLGGGSSINFMLYNRARPIDYDRWDQPGWSYKELLPFAKKLETFHGDDPKGVHGKSGPVHVTYDNFRSHESQDAFLEAARKRGFPTVPDLQDFGPELGFSRSATYNGPDGRRSDTAHRYLHPLLQDGKHPNLHVLVEHNVERVLFDGNKRANGVAFSTNPRFAAVNGLAVAEGASAPTQQVKARKLVIVSSGALGTPPVLERSGVGCPDILKKAGVEVVSAVPGVGADYQDHHLTLFSYKAQGVSPDKTNDTLMSGRKDRAAAIASNDFALSWNTCDVVGKTRPTEAEIDALGPEFRAMWDRDFAPYPERPLMLFGLLGMYVGDYSALPDPQGQYFTIGDYTAYPYSRGHLHITGPNAKDALDFDVGFLDDKDGIDLKKQVYAYKTQREIARRAAWFAGEVASTHPPFDKNGKAAVLDGPVDAATLQDVVYSKEDDAVLESWLRGVLATTWHSLGTAKMGKLEDKGVLDARLNVHGVTGLKVVDLSVAPGNVACNTNSTALMIGEKGADIVLKDLGLAH